MPSSSACRIDSVLDCISDRWTLGIIHKLSDGPRRALDLFGAFKGMSTKTLTARLKKLERDGVVHRRSYPESPPRVEYSLTDKGRELLPVLRTIAEVAFRWDDETGATKEEPACRPCAALYGEILLEETRPAPVIETIQPDDTTWKVNEFSILQTNSSYAGISNSNTSSQVFPSSKYRLHISSIERITWRAITRHFCP